MTNNTTYATLAQAIKGKNQIHATYRGHPREMCPHAIGTKNGIEHILSYQFGGTSRSGLPAGGEWRCMVVAELTDVSIHEGQWHTGNSHTKPQTCIDQVDVEVAH